MLKYKNIVVLSVGTWDAEKSNLFAEEFLNNPPTMKFDIVDVMEGKTLDPIGNDRYKIEDAHNILIFSFENLEDATLFKLRWS